MTLSGFKVMEVATGCHVWLGSKQTRGYGQVGDGNGRTVLAHRMAWEDAHGPIPDGLTIDHLCQNKGCVNPEHMELVTAAENTARAGRRHLYCPRGHEYTPENTNRNSRGWRYCRECHLAAQRAKYAAARDKATQ